MLKNIFKNVAASGLGLLLALIALEVLLQVYNPLNFRVKGNEIFLPSNQKFRIENTLFADLDTQIIHNKNSLGFRGAEPPENIEEGLSIITVGGSTTESFYISDGDTWSDILFAELSRHFHNFWGNNAGLDGHSTFGHLILQRDYLLKLQPDVLVFLIGINDVGRNAPRSFDQQSTQQLNLSGSLKSAIISLERFSEVLNLAHNVWRWIKANKAELGHGQVKLSSIAELRLSNQEIEIITKSYEKSRQGYRERIDILAKKSIDAGILPIFVTQPHLAGGGIDPETGIDLRTREMAIALEGGGQKANGEAMWNVLESYNQIVRELGREKNYTVIDLARKMPKTSAYFYDLIHFNKKGSSSVGQVLFKELCPILAEHFNHKVKSKCDRRTNQ